MTSASTDGVLYIVGIGPGLPDYLTQQGREVIQSADCVIVADRYRQLLQADGILPADADRSEGVTILQSTRDTQATLAREAFDRVRAGQSVVHISGGDPNVYGKSDLLFRLAREEAAVDIPIEIVPGVTAALGGAAALGAPLSNDFCTISLSTASRDWEAIETKLRAAAQAGFVIVLYNCWRHYEAAITVLQAARASTVPVGIFREIGRGEHGQHGEFRTITTLGAATSVADAIKPTGTSVLIGTADTQVWETDHGQYLITPRGTQQSTQPQETDQ